MVPFSIIFVGEFCVTIYSFQADPAYGLGVAEALGLSLEEALIAEDPAHPEWDDR